MNTQLQLSLSSDRSSIGSLGDPVIKLEQESHEFDRVNMRDIYDMWTMAKSGITARNVKPYTTNIKFTETETIFSLGFYVWPFPAGTPYELSASLGIIDSGAQFSRERQKSITFPMSDTFSLETQASMINYEWETPTFNSFGETVPVPSIGITEGAVFVTPPEPIFGVARINFTEEGFYHLVEVTLPNVDEDGNNLKIEDVNITIIASWEVFEGERAVLETTELRLVIPDALKSALSMCGGSPGKNCQSCDDWMVYVYFSTCDGSILGEIRRELSKNGGSWCLPS